MLLQDPAVGWLPPRFEMVSTIGAGGMGEVYIVRDRESGAETALKLLAKAGGAAAAHFRHEFRCLADLRHPNLVRLGELFDVGEHLCFTMELVDGIHFGRWVSPGVEHDDAEVGNDESTLPGDSTEPPYDESRLRDAVAQLADGLVAIHRAGLVHRDLKPSNVMITPDARVVLLDFGIAIPERDLYESDLAVGTAVYMAPEQARAESPSPSADMYALGIMLYEVLARHAPFLGEDLDILMQKQRDDPTRPRTLYPETPADLDVLCMELLARDPLRRPTAEQVAERLRGALYAAAPAIVDTHRLRARTEVFVGRKGELAALLDGLAASASRPVVQMVVGGAGIGKSALLSAFAGMAGAEARLVSVGRCHQREHVRLDLWDALMEAITRDLVAMPRAQRKPLLPDDVAALVCAFPVFERLVPRAQSMSVPASELAQRAVVALRELLVRLGDRRPVVMIVDDAQWASEESLELLPTLLASPGPRLCLVLAARVSATLGATLSAVVARLAADRVDVRTLAVGPLSDVDTRVLARHLAPTRGDAIATAAKGNPLFVELLATGAATADAASAAKVIADRIAALPPIERDVVALVAAATGPVRQDVLARVLGAASGATVMSLAQLRELRLVRTTGTGCVDLVEPLHHTVRVAALHGMNDDTRQSLRVRLAAAIDADVASDPGLRVASWVAARDGPRAATAAIALVAKARDGLAFARAARACEAALALPLATSERSRLQAALGEALAGAGEGARAAVAFREAAADAAEAEQLDLSRRAAEHDLRAGYFERGMATAAPVTAALGLPLTASARRVIASLLIERGRLMVRGLVPRQGSVDPRAAAHADACHSLATGLAMVDFLRATWFQTRALRHSLDSGDPRRIARALAIEASHVSFSSRNGAVQRAGKLLRWAEAFAARVGSAELDGLVASSRALSDHARGDHGAAIRGFDAARTLMRERGVGAIWQEHTTEVFALWSLAWLGRWHELAGRRDRLLREAAATDDLMAGTFASIGFAIYPDIAAGRLVAAAERSTEAMARWGRAGFQTPHFHELIGVVGIELALGRGVAAHRHLVERWPALRRSRLLRSAWCRAITFELRARAALAAGELSEASAYARRLVPWPWLAGPALLVLAQVAAARGGDAAATLDRAYAACDDAELALHAAAALDRRGVLAGGDVGDTLRAEAARRAITRGAVSPEHTFALLAPLPPDRR